MRSRARNLELMEKQMLEMQRQQVAQTAVLNAYLQQRFMPPAPAVYPRYQPRVNKDSYKNEEDEEHYSYASLTQPEAPFRRNEGRYYQEGYANAKPSGGRVNRQTGHHQGTHQRHFPWTRSSYVAEITEAIPNLHVGIHTSNPRLPTREAGSSKAKKPFSGPYSAYHRFYGHRIEDCHDIRALAEQRTQKNDHPSFE
ncbi:hypothetical protein Fot_03329 [Forsythia ovata]|uniref:Uncharacterized protein n=1 Tax=Forsythia ovata TaxID=205694 RepID=A0ABD1XDF9_9LAMI